jgi:hypothetical protein
LERFGGESRKFPSIEIAVCTTGGDVSLLGTLNLIDELGGEGVDVDILH